MPEIAIGCDEQDTLFSEVFRGQQKAKKSSFFTANNKKQEWKRKCKHW
jgi:hypothetical protein